MKKVMFSITFLNFLNTICMAFEDMSDKNEQIEQVLNHNTYSPNMLSMVFGLLFVIGLIYCTAIVYKKLLNFKIGDIEQNVDDIKILKHLPLGQGKNLYVVKTGSSCCLIGAAQNSINHIKDLDEKDFIKEDNANKN